MKQESGNTLRKNFSTLLRDFTGLLFPRYCVACGTSLLHGEPLLCLRCLHELPRTEFQNSTDNPMARLFWGRCYAERASAWFSFLEGSRYQKMIHRMKYKGRKDIAFRLGHYFGAELSGTSFMEAEILIPVPLHADKLKFRGYNQSEEIARGMALAMKKDLNTTSLRRMIANPTQTHKSGFDRWENVEGIFELRETALLEGRHVVLVDDVVTTGATLDACANTLMKIPGIRISLAALAIV